MNNKIYIKISIIMLWLYVVGLTIYMVGQMNRSAKLHLAAAQCILTLQEYVAEQKGIDISDCN